MTETEIGEIVVDRAVKMHRRLGPGLLESVYETVLCYELQNRGLSIERQVPIPITYDKERFTNNLNKSFDFVGRPRNYETRERREIDIRLNRIQGA